MIYPEGSFFEQLFRDHPYLTIEMGKSGVIVIDRPAGHLSAPQKGATGCFGITGYHPELCKIAEAVRELM